jgi:hypothetical protein
MSKKRTAPQTWVNKNPSLNAVFNQKKDCSKEEILVSEGLSYPRVNVDKEVFKKSEEEKQKLKLLKRNLGVALRN